MKPDIAFIPTPEDAIQATLELAELHQRDLVYDLGCGDGRLLVRAAQNFGCRGVGIDIDPQRLEAARHLAVRTGTSAQLTFQLGNLFECDFHDATVVFIYLLPHLNLRLLPRLLNQLRPGTRVISHQFDMGNQWQPEKVVKLASSEEDSTLYRWRI